MEDGADPRLQVIAGLPLGNCKCNKDSRPARLHAGDWVPGWLLARLARRRSSPVHQFGAEGAMGQQGLDEPGRHQQTQPQGQKQFYQGEAVRPLGLQGPWPVGSLQGRQLVRAALESLEWFVHRSAWHWVALNGPAGSAS
ncbi:MAG: hypothetical protein RLZZ374_933 [Cyanobacteriota bacterium]